MEAMGIESNFWQGKTVFITGHTGFKGAWLSLWLQKLGAKVVGFALQPPTVPNLYESAGVGRDMISIYGDVRDEAQVFEALAQHRPDIIFHLAAQSLVRKSYLDPLETLSTNIMGTANVLNAVKRMGDNVTPKVLVNITTDKCYENKEWLWGYRETDTLGGYDPYSCSKACSELVTAAFRNSFFANKGIAIATARAGNVIGGGDWAEDRIVPDSIRALNRAEPIVVRNPHAIRPWQHVLEPLGGYLLLARKLWEHGSKLAEGWNFGPREEDATTVSAMTGMLCELWGNGASWQAAGSAGVHEAQFLKLDCSKARHRLAWQQRWTLRDTMKKTVEWYKAYYREEDMYQVTLTQIQEYEQILER